MNKKIIFFDIDGTLYDPEIGVPKSTQDGIKMLKENGHIPIICTGRTRPMIPEYLINIGFDGIVAGAGTYVEYKGELVHHKYVDDSYATDILPLLKEKNVKYVIEGPKNIYYDKYDKSKEYEFIREIAKTLGNNIVKPLQEESYIMNKITCSLTKDSDIESILPILEEKFDLICHEGSNLIELAMKGYNKAVGIQKLIHFLQIDKSNTYAFGDSTNDLEMLQYVEYGIAMGNAYPEVLKMSKYTTKSIKDDGIYHGLKEFGLI
ncbi:MAG: HAD-superfamily hydrolase, subfamily [Anaerocolumna sp.]|nr:HAD-superfamily hydrolase, subfamily [Anaerocolumna sp.]